VIGPPNAGKSTLLNAILKTDLSIVSLKPQTTRNNLAGILTDKERGIQIIITDTPGIIKQNKSLLDNRLQEAVYHAIKDTDIVLFLVPPGDSPANYRVILDKLENKSVILVLNKMDIEERTLDPEENPWGYDWISISALEKINLDKLLEKIDPLLTEKVLYYPEDVISDRTERFFVKEYIREAVLNCLKEEIPHQIFVDIEEMEKRNGLDYIQGVIYVERENHKSIVIGSKGSMIKKIGTRSRKRIELFLGNKVFLELKVKVHKKWRQDPIFLKKLEYY
jgi:GTP-binding protein Era